MTEPHFAQKLSEAWTTAPHAWHRGWI